jgi:glutathione synthase/RimK-type ligase-like ATP-grasp enzyme
MKKIGILFGRERSFPLAFIERVNSRNAHNIIAEPVHIDKVIQGTGVEYDVIIDRISQDVPFYRSYLKNAAICGTAVINNPFWWSADEKFFNNCLATKIGVPVPKTVILPSYELPTDTSHESFANLAYPLNWEKIFEYIGFPAYMKPFAGGGWKNVYKLHNKEDFFHTHKETGQLVMLLQEEIVFDAYYRCYCIGGKYVHIMPYEPRNPHHLRYTCDFNPSPDQRHQMEEIVRRINQYLGYDFNSVELAIRDGVPYAIDFCNPAPDADRPSVGDDNFEWVVETAATYAIERALTHQPGQNNLTWGEFTKRSVNSTPLGEMTNEILASEA